MHHHRMAISRAQPQPHSPGTLGTVCEPAPARLPGPPSPLPWALVRVTVKREPRVSHHGLPKGIPHKQETHGLVRPTACASP